jgi:tellurite methyltransferase
MIDGGYDTGYRECPCFWGSEPGSLIEKLAEIVPSFKNFSVLDAGCGEGKNSFFLADKGALVDAYDISQLAIEHAENLKFGHRVENVSFRSQDIRTVDLNAATFDVVIAYGLMHCLADETAIVAMTELLKRSTKNGGHLVLCAFNDRSQDLSAHPGFTPTLLPHTAYLSMFTGWEIIEVSDKDLQETHPHNNIPHTHSMTRIIAKKPCTATEVTAGNA